MTRRAIRLAVLTVAFGTLVVSPVTRLVLQEMVVRISREEGRIGGFDFPCPQDMILVAAADPVVGAFPGAAARLQGRFPAQRAWVLSMAPQDHRIEQVHESGFDLRVLGQRRPNFFELVHRPSALEAGDEVRLPGLSIRVLEAEPHGATLLRVHFGRALASPDVCFVQWKDGQIRPLELPPSGEELLIQHEPGPSGM